MDVTQSVAAPVAAGPAARGVTPSGLSVALIYVFVTFVSLIQQPGRTTYAPGPS